LIHSTALPALDREVAMSNLQNPPDGGSSVSTVLLIGIDLSAVEIEGDDVRLLATVEITSSTQQR
jgi:hypothetical protein